MILEGENTIWSGRARVYPYDMNSGRKRNRMSGPFKKQKTSPQSKILRGKTARGLEVKGKKFTQFAASAPLNLSQKKKKKKKPKPRKENRYIKRGDEKKWDHQKRQWHNLN